MDFDFTDDQEMLRDTVRRWVDKATTSSAGARIVKAGGFSREAWQEMADLGICWACRCPKRNGGLGFGPVDAMVVMEELGRGLVLEPYAAVALVATSLLKAGHAAVGGAVAAAHRRRQGARRPRPPGAAARAIASRTSRRPRTAGRRHLAAERPQDRRCRPARTPSAFIVPARVSGGVDDAAGIGLFLVSTGEPGVEVRGYPTQDGASARRPASEGAAAIELVAPGAAFAALENAVDIGIAALCAEAVGAMDKLVAITVEYMNTRKQFGVAIATLPGAAPPHRRRQDAARAGALDELLRDPQARREPAGAAARAGPGQGAAGPVDALRRPAVHPAARRHRRHRRVHREPLLQAPDGDRDDLRRHAAPARRGVAPHADTAGVFA